MAKRSQSVVPYSGSSSSPAFNDLKLGGGLKIKGYKAVTRPVLRQEDDRPFAVKITSEIKTGELTKADDKGRNPANICYVVNLETGEEQTLVVNAAMKSALERTYSDAEYVGKCFAMISKLRPHKEGRKIREYLIKEIEVE